MVRYLRFFIGKESVLSLDHGYPGSHGRKEVGVFDSDIAAADDDDTFRLFPEGEQILIGQISDLTSTFDRRYEGTGGRRQ
jgi:hypothetical protein